jgi:hypothetical protein
VACTKGTIIRIAFTRDDGHLFGRMGNLYLTVLPGWEVGTAFRHTKPEQHLLADMGIGTARESLDSRGCGYETSQDFNIGGPRIHVVGAEIGSNANI